MLTFFVYFLPIILLLCIIIVFKLFFVKKTKTYENYNRIEVSEKIVFPIWYYLVYLIFSFTPYFNWVFLSILCIYFLTSEHFFYPPYGENSWYDFSDEVLINILNTLRNNKFFSIIITPFDFLYKFLTKRI